jgi:hypothetical protein
LRQDLAIPKNWDEQSRTVTGGALYTRQDVDRLVSGGVLKARLFTEDSGVDAAKEGWALRDVLDLLKTAVEHGTYKNSKWCRQGKSPGGNVVPCAPCDGYSVIYHHREKGKIKCYVKFAISKTGTLLLIFSCHD